jgi:hypothetical protein
VRERIGREDRTVFEGEFRSTAVIEDSIRGSIEVTPQLVLMAKAYLAEDGIVDIRAGERAFVERMGADIREPVVINSSADIDAVVRAVARYLSVKIALGEAAWALLGAGALVPLPGGWEPPRMSVGWTTVSDGNGQSSSWSFDDIAVPHPGKLSIAPSRKRGVMPAHLADPDMFLSAIDVDVHPVIGESIRSAVLCLRADLYLPALAMLGKACEGAWTLVGVRLAERAPTSLSAAKRLGKDLEAGTVTFAKLLDRVVAVYEHQEEFRTIARRSRVSLDDLRGFRAWSNIVRESRNVLDPLNVTAIPTTHETAAAIFLGAPEVFRGLLAIADSAARAPRRVRTRAPEAAPLVGIPVMSEDRLELSHA